MGLKYTDEDHVRQAPYNLMARRGERIALGFDPVVDVREAAKQLAWMLKSPAQREMRDWLKDQMKGHR